MDITYEGTRARFYSETERSRRLEVLYGMPPCFNMSAEQILSFIPGEDWAVDVIGALSTIRGSMKLSSVDQVGQVLSSVSDNKTKLEILRLLCPGFIDRHICEDYLAGEQIADFISKDPNYRVRVRNCLVNKEPEKRPSAKHQTKFPHTSISGEPMAGFGTMLPHMGSTGMDGTGMMGMMQGMMQGQMNQMAEMAKSMEKMYPEGELEARKMRHMYEKQGRMGAMHDMYGMPMNYGSQAYPAPGAAGSMPMPGVAPMGGMSQPGGGISHGGTYTYSWSGPVPPSGGVQNPMGTMPTPSGMPHPGGVPGQMGGVPQAGGMPMPTAPHLGGVPGQQGGMNPGYPPPPGYYP